MLPAEPGTYALVLRSSSTRTIRIGRIGALTLRPGYYVYIGSAFGPGGLRARIARHARRAASPRWHVDYLRRYARIESVCYYCGEHFEHELAAAIRALPGAAVPMQGFGSSDCGCEAHLLWFAEWPLGPELDLVAHAFDRRDSAVSCARSTSRDNTAIRG